MRTMPRALSKSQVATELLQSLDENNLHGFAETVQIGLAVDADWEYKYGKESGYKTILQLALEEDDGEPYVAELVRAGAKANHINSYTGNAPIHTAASEAIPEIFSLLFKYPENRADPNVVDKDGLTPFHVLLAQLIDLANLETKGVENRGSNPPTDEDIDLSMLNVLECLLILINQRDFRLDFNKALSSVTEKSNYSRSKITLKKLGAMTPLQLLCSFQTWNAKPITHELHDRLAEVISILLTRGADPNATGAVNALPGTVPGSTPAVFLAATRGYYKVVALFKKNPNTDFLVMNKFQQTILHVTIKAGYYNKVVSHGDESGFGNIETVRVLFNNDSIMVQQQMRGIVNRVDTYGNTALHYAKPYPDQSVVKILLQNGGKIDRNPQGAINVNPRTLEEHFLEHCLVAEGDDIDDEEFRIRINYQLFEKPTVNASKDMAKMKEAAMAWTLDVENDKKKNSSGSNPNAIPSSGRVDTKRLEYFSDVDSLHYLLKHPVVASFLEMELNSLRFRYMFDFIFYLIFVIVLYIYFSDRFGISERFTTVNDEKGVVKYFPDTDYTVTYSMIVLCVVLGLLVLREFWQMFKMRKRYFKTVENYIEWLVIILTILCLLPAHYFEEELQRHLAALALLIAFMQLYLVFVRAVPNTPIPVYINMFTTVLKTYAFILISYFAFILSFAHSFYLIFHLHDNIVETAEVTNATNATSDATAANEDKLFGSTAYSLVKTLTMFVGEMEYNDLVFRHWLGYVIFLLFLFLVMIVLMNVLNGLAVSDINKIQEEVDTYYHVSIVETLSHTSFVSLLAEEVILYPNTRPVRQRILGLSVPGLMVYKAKGGKQNDPESKMKDFYFREDTVKSAKELVSMKQKENQSIGKASLENVREAVQELKRDQGALKTKLNAIDENIKTLMEIMASRNPAVMH